MAVDPIPSGPTDTAKVAVKLAFSRGKKSRLMEEHRVYSHLHSSGVQGIPRDIGLFVDEEPLLDAEGPYALVTSYGRLRSSQASSQPRLFINSNTVYRDSLLATLKLVHLADVLHGDTRLSDLCSTPLGDASLIDFSLATKSYCCQGCGEIR